MFRCCCVYLAALGCSFLPLEAGAVKEAVKDVRFRPYGNKVYISYTLEGKGEYEVSLRVSDDGGRTFSIVPKSLSGAVGKGEEPGNDKGIIWDALRDVPHLEGDDFLFEVVAIRNRNQKPLIVLLGLAAAFAAAAAVEASRGQEDATITLEIPDPEESP